MIKGPQKVLHHQRLQQLRTLMTDPTGSVTISGTATQGETLTASNTLADADGLGTITYTWSNDATGSSITLGQGDVGNTITVTASYTDTQGTSESVASSATSAVANVNDDPTGSVTISGTATQGETLTASNDVSRRRWIRNDNLFLE